MDKYGRLTLTDVARVSVIGEERFMLEQARKGLPQAMLHAKVRCRYCDQPNWAMELKCWACGAPLPIILPETSYEKEQARPSGTAYLVTSYPQRSGTWEAYRERVPQGYHLQQPLEYDEHGVAHSVGELRLERD